MLKIKKNRRRKIIAAICLLLVASGVLVYFILNNRDKPPISTVVGADNINYSPPTETDKIAVEQNKERIVNSEQNVASQPQANGKKSVKPTITYVGQYGRQIEVGAYINVFEDNGLCTAKFINGSKVVTKTVKALRNVNTTDCPAMIATNEEFQPKGTWLVTVTYDSQATTGTSDSRQLEIK